MRGMRFFISRNMAARLVELRDRWRNFRRSMSLISTREARMWGKKRRLHEVLAVRWSAL